jgi:hypothetical protein
MVKAGAAANQFVDFSGDFNTTEARSHDNEAEMPASALGIAGGLGLFHLTDNVLAQVYRIARMTLKAKAFSVIPGMMLKLLSAPQAITT